MLGRVGVREETHLLEVVTWGGAPKTVGFEAWVVFAPVQYCSEVVVCDLEPRVGPVG